MKFVCFSDTHGRHEEVKIPDGDVLIFAGDYTGGDSSPLVLRRFLCWLSLQPHKYKVMIAGNHDRVFERDRAVCCSILRDYNDINYLEDKSIHINGIKIHGSPVTPAFNNWAFNRERGVAIKRHWDHIADDVDILVTHGPAAGFLDVTDRMERVGCQDLLAAIERVQPAHHVFGHVHFAYGTSTLLSNEKKVVTYFHNVSLCGEDYRISRPPQVFIYDKPSPAPAETLPDY